MAPLERDNNTTEMMQNELKQFKYEVHNALHNLERSFWEIKSKVEQMDYALQKVKHAQERAELHRAGS